MDVINGKFGLRLSHKATLKGVTLSLDIYCGLDTFQKLYIEGNIQTVNYPAGKFNMSDYLVIGLRPNMSINMAAMYLY